MFYVYLALAAACGLLGVVVCVRGPTDIQVGVGLNLIVLGGVFATLGKVHRLDLATRRTPH